jgi:carbamate kinase
MKDVAGQPIVVVAIGGNALIRAGERATVALERHHVAQACHAIANLASAGWRVVVTHGNGPQVGAALLRSDRAAPEAYPLPLDVCVAVTQAEVGLLLQRTLEEEFSARHLDRPVATVITQVVVKPGDSAFARPTKPIGPHGHQRLVPSPEPLEIVEERVIRTLVNANAVVIALGGGGVPVVRSDGRLIGVEAVVDKDIASALLARRLQADLLVLLTDVDRIYLDFGSDRARGLDKVTTSELHRAFVAGQFPPGSMGPKVEAALQFVDAGGREAIVAAHDQLDLAIEGRAGTHVIAQPLTAAPGGTASDGESP